MTTYTGLPFASGVVLSPLHPRDRDGQARLDGHVTIGTVAVNFVDTGGLVWALTSPEGTLKVALAGDYTPSPAPDPGTALMPTITYGNSPALLPTLPAPLTASAAGVHSYAMDDLADEDPLTEVITKVGTYPRSKAVIPIGQETGRFSLSVNSYLWTPLNIVGIEFTGQYFTRGQRIT